MATQVVTQLIVDASGIKQSEAQFIASMEKMKKAAVDTQTTTATGFERAQQRWTQSLGATDPVIKAQIKMENDLARQRSVNTDAVKLGIATQAAADAQLKKVQQGHEANIKTIREQNGLLSQSERAWGAVKGSLTGVQGQLVALSAGAGPVGTFLSALGPWGVVAAVGLGAAAAAIRFVADESNRMGDKAIQIRQFSEATGLTVAQISALRKAGSQFGIEGETIASGFQRLTFSMNDARQASGTLFHEVREVSGGLAEQLRQTTTTAEGIDVLARAWRDAGNEAQKAAIARAVFGRSGAGAGPVLGLIAAAGGLDALASKTKTLIEATDEQNRRWAQMRAETVELEKKAKNILASIFTEEGLTAGRAAAQIMQDVALQIKHLSEQPGGLTFRQRAVAELAAWAPWLQNAEKVREIMGPQQTRPGDTVFGLSPAQLAAAAASLRTLATAATVALPAVDNLSGKVKTLKEQQDEAAASAKLMSDRIGALGSAATINEQLQQRVLKIESDRLNNVFSLNKAENDLLATRAKAAAGLDARSQIDALRVGQLGELASATELFNQKETALQKSIRDGARFSEAELAAIRARNLIQANAAQPENQIKQQREMLLMTEQEAAIRQKFIGWGIDYNGVRGQTLAQELRILDAQKLVADGFKEVGQSIFTAFVTGKSAMDAMIQSLDALAKKLADAAFNNLVQGLMTGNWVQAGIGAAQAVASAGISVFTGDQKQRQKEKEARDAWAKQRDAYLEFLDVWSGQGPAGQLTSSIKQIKDQVLPLLVSATTAKDWGSVNTLTKTSVDAQINAAKDFMRTFDATMRAMADGFGPDSPFASAVDAVKNALARSQAFINDTRTAANILAGSSDFGRTADLASPAARAGIERQLQSARGAAQTSLLAMLTGDGDLSEVQQKLMSLQGTAAGLQGALQSLGLTADQAATAINEKLGVALDKLRADFLDDLTRQLNDATGKGFLNDIADLMKQVDQMRKDAALLGGGQDTLIDRILGARAQEVIDQANLTGDAFNDLVRTFPTLTGRVHESTQALEEAAQAEKERIDAINQTAQTVVQFLQTLQVGQSSGQSPQAQYNAAKLFRDQQIILAQAGNVDAQKAFPKYAQDFLDASKAMFGSSLQYQLDRSQIISQGLSLPAVGAATDPVVIAVRDAIEAIKDVVDNTGPIVDIKTNTSNLADYIGTGDGSGLRLLVSQMKGYIGAGDGEGLRKLVSDVGTYIGSGDTTGLRKLVDQMADYIGSGDTIGLRKLVSDVGTYIGSGDTTGLRKLVDQMAGYIGSGDTVGLQKLVKTAADNIGSTDGAGVRLLMKNVSDYIGSGDTTGLRNLVNNVATYIGSGDTSGLQKLVKNVSDYIGSGDTVGLQKLVKDVGTYIGSGDTIGLQKLVKDVGTYIGTGDTAGLRLLVDQLGDYVGPTDTAGLRKSASDTKAAVEASKLLDDAIKTATEGMKAWGAAGVLDAIKGLNDTATTQLTLLQEQYASTAISFPGAVFTKDAFSLASVQDRNKQYASGSASGSQADIKIPTSSDPLSNNMLSALNKIVWNTYTIAFNTGEANVRNASIPRLYGVYAQGGLAPANTLAIYAEHSLGGPRMMRTTEPTYFSPGFPSNDNSAVVSEMRAMRREMADQNFKIAQLINMVCVVTGRSSEEIVTAIEGQTESRRAIARQENANPRRKAS